jgi:hypothetical protein
MMLILVKRLHLWQNLFLFAHFYDFGTKTFEIYHLWISNQQLNEKIKMNQLERYEVARYGDLVCKLNKAIYGLQ